MGPGGRPFLAVVIPAYNSNIEAGSLEPLSNYQDTKPVRFVRDAVHGLQDLLRVRRAHLRSACAIDREG